MHDFDKDLDPDSHVLNERCDTSKYYTDYEFNLNVNSRDSLSLVHFNIRSLYANFNKLKDYITTFTSRFKIIALSETWISDEKGVDFEIEGYKLYHVSRSEKRGGGVALYVDSLLKCELVEKMSIAIEGIFECVAVEIDMGKNRNVIAGCIYRAQGSKIDVFQDKFEQLLDTQNNHKTFLISGDFNIDFLNQSKCKFTSDFLEALYTRSLFFSNYAA